MGAFLGCCVIALVLWVVGRRIARTLYLISGFIELIGQNSVPNWPPLEEWTRGLKE